MLRRVITGLHADLVDSDAVWNLPSDAQEQLPAFWRETDAVIAIPKQLDGSTDDSTMVDIGIALGKGLPILVLVADDMTLPGLPNLKTAKASLNNSEALRFHVSLFLESVRSKRWFRKSMPMSSYVQFDVALTQNALNDIRRMSSGPRKGHAYEDWVARIFEKMGATVESPPSDTDRGFDLVLSLPGLEQGPLLVEIKGQGAPGELVRTALRLQALVLEEQAGLGLVLYEDEKLTATGKSLPGLPTVVVLGISEFLKSLEKGESAARVLLRARNEAVHKP